MRLKRLNKGSSESKSLKKRVQILLKNGVIDLGVEANRLGEISLLRLNADVKNSTSAIALNVEFQTDDRSIESKQVFIKKPSAEAFYKEQTAVRLLRKKQMHQFDNLHIPLQFIESDLLVVSDFATGQNMKLILRENLLLPVTRKRTLELTQNFREFGRWLAKFHIQFRISKSIDTKTQFSSGLEDLLYPSQHSVLLDQSSEQFVYNIRRALLKVIRPNYLEYVHGDFGPHNILLSGESFEVVDWECFHQGHAIEDCIQFVINILTQSRLRIFDFGFTHSLIDAFLAGYESVEAQQKEFAASVVLIAISNIYKRQEWSGRPFSMLESKLFFPLLKRLAVSHYANLKVKQYN